MGSAWRQLRSSARDRENREALLRAARVLEVKSRRAARGLFSGSYTSAFRGGGMVFQESRPYLPGDDVRRLDWNAIARTGQPFVKHYHEERNRTVSILLDTSPSMSLRSSNRRFASAAETGAHVAALLASVAGQVGDRAGLVVQQQGGVRILSPARGQGQAARIIEAALLAATRPSKVRPTERLVPHLERTSRGDGLVFVISDFRTPEAAGAGPWPRALAQIAAREDLVCIAVEDPQDSTLPDVGRVALRDPEAVDAVECVDTADDALRARFAAAAKQRRKQVTRSLQHVGGDVLWLRTDRNPLHELDRYFQERAARVGVGPMPR